MNNARYPNGSNCSDCGGCCGGEGGCYAGHPAYEVQVSRLEGVLQQQQMQMAPMQMAPVQMAPMQMGAAGQPLPIIQTSMSS